MKKHTKCLSIIFLNLLLGLGAFNFQSNLNAMEDVGDVKPAAVEGDVTSRIEGCLANLNSKKLPPLNQALFEIYFKEHAETMKLLNTASKRLEKQEREFKKNQPLTQEERAKFAKRRKIIFRTIAALMVVSATYAKGVYESGSWNPRKAFPAFGRWSWDCLKNAFYAVRKSAYESRFPASRQAPVIDQFPAYSDLNGGILEKCASAQKFSECYGEQVMKSAAEALESVPAPIAPISNDTVLTATVSTPVINPAAPILPIIHGSRDIAPYPGLSRPVTTKVSVPGFFPAPATSLNPAPAPTPISQFPGQGAIDIYRGDVIKNSLQCPFKLVAKLVKAAKVIPVIHYVKKIFGHA